MPHVSTIAGAETSPAQKATSSETLWPGLSHVLEGHE